jgi:O-acetyl-ADP-ribose deacetylase (regulator of RNase III)
VARNHPAIRSIAFPAISTGAYGFPRDEAARIALSVLRDHAGELDRVVAVVFSDADRALYLDTLASLS